jgi:ferredoxin-type protein NapF
MLTLSRSPLKHFERKPPLTVAAWNATRLTYIMLSLNFRQKVSGGGNGVATAASKRLLFARLRGGMPQIRPPWSIPEPAFSESCDQCGHCIGNCPQKIVVPGIAGYPAVDFNRGACAESCTLGCFAPDRSAKPWHIAASVGPSCIEMQGVTCRLCQDACHLDAIHFRPQLGGGSAITVDRAACTGCGACVAPCPVGAVTIAGSQAGEVLA